MKYQLILQFPDDSIQGLDALIALEDQLIEVLEPVHVVDGHDVGSGEMNIFVHTDDPLTAFACAQKLIPAGAPFEGFKAAYREFAGDSYTVIRPMGDTEPFNVK